jgi:hypothetical protein
MASCIRDKTASRRIRRSRPVRGDAAEPQRSSTGTEGDTDGRGRDRPWRTEAWAGCDCCVQMGESGELGSWESKGQSEAGLRAELDGNGVVYLRSHHWDSRRGVRVMDDELRVVCTFMEDVV